LGSAVCEAVNKNSIESQVITIGINDCFGESGKYDELLERYGLSAEAIYTKIKKTV
jgi:transketolase